MIRDVLVSALTDALVAVGVEPPPSGIDIERPANRDHGDWSSNVALARAKAAGRNPRELAGELVAHLAGADVPHVAGVEIAGPGFVNFRLYDTWLYDVLRQVEADGVDGYARLEIAGGQRVLVEFVSANPTGPLHAGHARGAVYGDSLARVLERCGHEVGREYLLNDRGMQMQHFADSIAAAAAGEPTPESGYQGAYIDEWATELPPDVDSLEWAYARCRTEIEATLERLDIHFEYWHSERDMVASGAIEATLADLRAAGVVDDADDAVWLRATDFGDDKDRVLVKSDGEPTYLLPDIAYHRDKFARGWDLLINVWGADHHGYVPRMKAAIQALGHDPDDLEIQVTQLVRLERGGTEVKIGKRSGEFIELAEIIDEVGADATRFTYLLQSIDSQQTIDLAVIASQTMDNPVFYVQMAHARARSIQRKAAETGFASPDAATVDLSPLGHRRELEVLRALSELPDLLGVACRERAPHKVATWVRQLAAAFHGFHHDCYVIGDGIPPELTAARLALVDAARIGLAIGLGLLGVSAPEEMR